jgi:uncharacterized pyridoxamine 5'-phosphate oxidase family protein
MLMLSIQVEFWRETTFGYLRCWLFHHVVHTIPLKSVQQHSFQEAHMNSAFEFLKANPVFHLATVDGTKARVRPFGFSMKRNDRLYFCTNKTKDVYKQLVKYPDIEISAMGADGTWLRVRGKIAFDESRDAKVQAFAEAPNLLRLYPKGADDEIFVTFYFTEAQATLSSFSEAPKNIPLL